MDANWENLKKEIDIADGHINRSDGIYTEFYTRQRVYWKGVKHGIGLAFKIIKKFNN